VKIKVTSTGKTTIDADAEYQEPQIRAALVSLGVGEAADDYVASAIIDHTDSERSDISHDEYAIVTEDDGTELWAGWLDGRDEPAPDSAEADADAYLNAIVEMLAVFDDDAQMTEELLSPHRIATAESSALIKIREIGRRAMEGRSVRVSLPDVAAGLDRQAAILADCARSLRAAIGQPS